MQQQSSTTQNTHQQQQYQQPKLTPKILPGRLHKDNRCASDWSWQNLLAYGCHSHVAIIDPAYLNLVQTLDEHRHNVCLVRWSRDTISGAVKQSDALAQQQQQTAAPGIDHYQLIAPMARLASADTGGTIIVWDVLAGSVIQSLGAEHRSPHPVRDLQWHPEDNNLLFSIMGGAITLWSVTNGSRVWRRDLCDAPCVSLQVDPFCNITTKLLVGAANGSVHSVCVSPSPDEDSEHGSSGININFINRITSKLLPNGSGYAGGSISTSHQASTSTSSGSGSNSNGPSLSLSSSSSSTTTSNNNKHVQTPTDLIKIIYSPITKNFVYYVFPREIIVHDITSNQSFGSTALDRSKSSFNMVILCRENPNLMFSLHEDGSITSWSRKYIDVTNTHSYEQLCVSDLSHYHMKSKKKGLPLYSITHHPFNEQTLLTIGGDGIIWKWDFTSEMLSGGAQQFSARLSSLSVKPLNGVVKLGASGMSDSISSPISSMAVYPFANRNNMSLLAIGTVNGTIQLVNATTLKVQKELFIWQQPVFGLRWASPGRVICYSYEEVETGKVFHNRLAFVDLRSGRVREIRQVAANETAPIRGLKLSNSRKFLVVLVRDRPFELWEMKRFTCLRSFKAFSHVTGLEWVPSLEDSEVAISQDPTKYEAKEQFIFFTSDSTQIKCCTIEGNSVTLNDMPMEGFSPLSALGGSVTPQLAHAVKRDLMVAADVSGAINVWSSEKKRLVSSFTTSKAAIKKIRFSPSPTSIELLVLFVNGEFGIWDVLAGVRTASGTYLSERDIKVLDIEWLSDSNPIVVASDYSIRILDNSLCLSNSPVNNTIGGSSTTSTANIFEAFLYSPLLLSPFCALQLKNLLHAQRSSIQAGAANEQNDADLNKSQATSMLVMDQLEKNTRLLSLVDERLLSYLAGCTTAEGCLAIAQFFGDHHMIKFWRLVLFALQRYNDRTPCTSLYNTEIMTYYNELPSKPPVPINEPTSTVSSTTATPSTSTTHPSTTSTATTLSNNNAAGSAPGSPLMATPTKDQSNNPFINPTPLTTTTTTTNVQQQSTQTQSQPHPQPHQSPQQQPQAKKSFASFFGGLTQGLTSKASIPNNNPAPKNDQTMPKQSNNVTPTPNNITSATQSTSQNQTSSSSNQATSSTSNPLAASQMFHSVSSQLQSQSHFDFLGASTTMAMTASTLSSSGISPASSSLAFSGAVSFAPATAGASLPVYYDLLTEPSVLRSSELDRADMHERKKPDAELTRRLIDRNISLGRSHRAINLLLDTTPDHPDFYMLAVKASVIAASISQEYYQSTMKLLANNLIAVGKLDEGVQFLCLIDKSLDACKYLQAAGRWNEAAMLAKTSLREEEYMVVYRAWALHLVELKRYEQAIEILLSMGDFCSVIQLLYENKQYDEASHLIEACEHHFITNNEDGNNDDSGDLGYTPITQLTSGFTMKQLVQIIFKEYGNNLHQMGNIQASHHYWKKCGTRFTSSSFQ
ncbi:hypothetical protein SAMD00019534_097530 [Acytostelium subglobosum LB1]|uniref:hypothetical protein n=1 Tax=Acytostelium subglobosum LB1 TaxID=1410327 RepID=UPI0006449EE8|nr:hypothetical protein SAMD00019534_097530 [Acytostelium subglobosum LB1]GAM26578.1 hypothetical protein SAMD00019534_097530 [Acytostelium subglobosum LB1]|eukprot:XP_012750674.1 hypothetical protein SAMD00019534_097530 [Acytostelium subglobosum LB1]